MVLAIHIIFIFDRTFPLLNNAIFLAFLLYYSMSHQDKCYDSFRTWIEIRQYLLTLIMIGIIWVLLETSSHREKVKP
jgi:hypothetical protein